MSIGPVLRFIFVAVFTSTDGRLFIFHPPNFGRRCSLGSAGGGGQNASNECTHNVSPVFTIRIHVGLWIYRRSSIGRCLRPGLIVRGFADYGRFNRGQS
jgi:hypothetical protein